MSETFSKTAKGQDEIKTRAGGLSQRIRQVLIFIDGKRHRDELHAMLKGDDIDSILALLVNQGFAEISGTPDQAPPAPADTAMTIPPAAPKPSPKAPAAPKLTPEELVRKQLEEEEHNQIVMARSFMGKMS